jgi:hypothetical protein
MLLFRSEEHVDRWCAARKLARGASFTPQQLWEIAKPWHGPRLDRDWRRFTPDEAQAVFDRAGLTGAFWQFPRPPAAPNDKPGRASGQ